MPHLISKQQFIVCYIQTHPREDNHTINAEIEWIQLLQEWQLMWKKRSKWPQSFFDDARKTMNHWNKLYKSNNPHSFEKWGSGIRLSGHDHYNQVTNIGTASYGWNTCYGKWKMNINENNYKIYLYIDQINLNHRSDICIGIASSDDCSDSYFHSHKNDPPSYGYKADGKLFANGVKIGRFGNGYRTDDILILSIVNKHISWCIDNRTECLHKCIESDMEYTLAISMMRRSKRDSITIVNVEKTINNDTYFDEKEEHKGTTYSALQQREVIRKLGDFDLNVGESWYAISKKWHDQWVNYTLFETDDADIITLDHRERPARIDNSDLILNMNAMEICVVYGYIYQVQQMFCVDSVFRIIPEEITQMCLSYYATPMLKDDLVRQETHIWIHKDVWDCFFLWYDGGPAIARMVYQRRYSDPYICVYPKLIKLIYCDETGGIEHGNVELRLFPPDYSLKAITTEIEDDFEKGDDSDIPYVHIWLRFAQLKSIYLSEQNVIVTEDDLKNEDPQRWVEVPDDYRKCLKLNEIEWEDNEIIEMMIERRRRDNTWPRVKLTDDNDYRLLNIQIGDIIDCKDHRDRWYTSVVRNVFIDCKDHEHFGMVIIHYIGWNIKWDCMKTLLDPTSVAKRFTKTKNPHRLGKTYDGY